MASKLERYGVLI